MDDIFFEMLTPIFNPYFKPVEELRWYWRTENCDEPIGPFESLQEAEKDYQEWGDEK